MVAPIAKKIDEAILFDEPIRMDDVAVVEPKSADAALLFSGEKMSEEPPKRAQSPQKVSPAKPVQQESPVATRQRRSARPTDFSKMFDIESSQSDSPVPEPKKVIETKKPLETFDLF